MKLALASTLCALAALLAWTLVVRDRAGVRALDPAAGEPAVLATSDRAPRLDDAAATTALREDASRDLAVAGESSPEASTTGAREVTIVARATTRDGAPIPRATLTVALADRHTTRAAGDGRLALSLDRAELERLAGAAERASIELWVGAEGFGTRSVAAEIAEGTDRIVLGDVVLGPGGAVFGRVVDPTGLGVEGALVEFGLPHLGDRDAAHRARRGPARLDDADSRALTAQSGTGGAFRITGVPVGYGVAWARTATSEWAHSEPVGVRAGEEVGAIELVVHDARDDVISGRVVDPDGRALAGIELHFQAAGKPGAWNVEHSAADGSFHYVPPPGVAQDIRASSPSPEWEPAKLDGVAPGTHGLELAFARARWLEVVVTDESGAPIANGKALGLPASGSTAYPLPRCEGRLDAAGRARLRRPEQALRVRVESPGFRDVVAGPFEPSAFPEPLAVTMTRVPALVGRVTRPDGAPAAGARISLHLSATPPADGDAPKGHLTHQSWQGDRDPFVYVLAAAPTAVVRADDDGRYRLPLPGVDARAPEEADARPEAFDVLLAPDGSASRRLATIDRRQAWFVHAAADGHATVTSGPHVFDPTRDVELDLALPLGGVIAGRLVLEGPGSTYGWTAYASDGLAEVARAEVGEDGSFRLERLHAGPWQVRVFEPMRAFFPGGRMRTDRVPVADVHVVAGEEVEHEHRSERLDRARLRGRLAIDGAAPGPLVVEVTTSTPQSAFSTSRTTLDPDGEFELELQAGLKTKLSVIGPYRGTRLTVQASLEIAPGENDWGFEFATASLECRAHAAAFPPSPLRPMTYVSERGPVTVRVPFEPTEPGRYGPYVVPAGRGRMDGPLDGFDAPPRLLGQLDLAPGESHVLDLR